jgi:hypothetical protein
MKPNIAELANIYVNARYTLAQEDADEDAVRIGKLFGAKRDCRTLEAVFPQLTDLSFSRNKQTRQWDVRYGESTDYSNEWSYRYPADAVAHAKRLVRDIFKEGDPHAA